MFFVDAARIHVIPHDRGSTTTWRHSDCIVGNTRPHVSTRKAHECWGKMLVKLIMAHFIAYTSIALLHILFSSKKKSACFKCSQLTTTLCFIIWERKLYWHLPILISIRLIHIKCICWFLLNCENVCYFIKIFFFKWVTGMKTMFSIWKIGAGLNWFRIRPSGRVNASKAMSKLFASLLFQCRRRQFHLIN